MALERAPFSPSADADINCDSEVAESKLDNRELLRKFIEIYETLPELWDSSNISYMNKVKRNSALDKLLVVYAQMKPGAKRDDVRKKINNLRSNYRKEMKKILTSKRSGIGTDEIYNPSSWVFHALSFLRKTEVPASLNSPESILNDSQMSQTESAIEGRADLTPAQQSTSSMSSIGKLPPPKKKLRAVGPVAKQNELLTLACEYLSKPKNEVNDDVNLALARVWANKLTTLQPRQKILAEKAINDILFEAQLGNLNRDSVKINENPNIPYATMYYTTPSMSSTPTPTLSSPPPAHTSDQQINYNNTDGYIVGPAQNDNISDNLVTLFSSYGGE